MENNNITVKDAILTIRNELKQLRFAADDDANITHTKAALNMDEVLLQWVIAMEQNAAQKAKAKAAEEAEDETAEAPEEAAEG